MTNETSCADSAPLGMKMGFSGGISNGSVFVVKAFVVGDC